MDAITLAQILDLLKDGGTLALLTMVLWGGAKEWWVWGWYYRSVVKERDEWRRLALSGTNVAEKLAAIAVTNSNGGGQKT